MPVWVLMLYFGRVDSIKNEVSSQGNNDEKKDVTAGGGSGSREDVVSFSFGGLPCNRESVGGDERFSISLPTEKWCGEAVHCQGWLHHRFRQCAIPALVYVADVVCLRLGSCYA